jgi:hypothetical protein
MIIALIAALSCGFGFTFARRCIRLNTNRSRNRTLSVIGSMPFWFILLTTLVVAVPYLRLIAINYFGGNGFTMAAFLTCLVAAAHFEILGRLYK